MTTTLNPAIGNYDQLKYDPEFLEEYIRESGYKSYMGSGTKGQMMPFHAIMDLKSKGKTIRCPLITRIKSGGVSGNAKLAGNETPIDLYSDDISIEIRRQGIETSERDVHFSFADYKKQSRPLLKNFAIEMLRDYISNGLGMVTVAGNVAKLMHVPPALTVPIAGPQVFSPASTAELNKWVTDNTVSGIPQIGDRMLFGGDNTATAALNMMAGNFAGSLANLDTTNDTFTPAALKRMKLMARKADPHIRPIRNGKDGREYYVAFAGSFAFQAFKNHPEMVAVNRDARPREGRGMDDNPLFQDGDLLLDGVIVREIPEMPSIDKALYGTVSNIDRVFLCGAQAVGIAWGMEPMFADKYETDYGHTPGISVKQMLGCKKLQWNDPTSGKAIDHGVITGIFACNY
jgi:hypothetical protein